MITKAYFWLFKQTKTSDGLVETLVHNFSCFSSRYHASLSPVRLFELFLNIDKFIGNLKLLYWYYISERRSNESCLKQ